MQQQQQDPQFSEPSKLAHQFRKQIRRKDIDKRLAQRRRQMLEEERMQAQGQGGTTALGQGGEGELSDELYGKQVRGELDSLVGYYKGNGAMLDKKGLKELARISCTIVGCEVIIGGGEDLLNYALSEYYYQQKYNQTTQLNWCLLTLNNLLTATESQPSTNSTNPTPSTLVPTLTTTPQFLTRLLTILSSTQKPQIKQNVLSSLFCIVYNNGQELAKSLVCGQQFMVMGLLANQVYTEPTKNVILEIFRVYYLIVRKLEFGNYQQFARMRKFILLALKNSNSLQISLISSLCLYALLRSIPAQRTHLPKSTLLPTLYQQSLAYRNPAFTINTLKITSLLITDQKNENQAEVEERARVVLRYLEGLVMGGGSGGSGSGGGSGGGSVEESMYVFKILYDVLANCFVSVQGLFTDFPKFTQKIIQTFQSNQTDKDLIIQLCYCLALLASKSKQIPKPQTHKIRTRIKQIIDCWDIDQKSVAYLAQGLEMLESIEKMSDV